MQVVARVTVGVRPQLVGRPNELDVTVGDEATFECKYKAFPSPDVYWYHNKQPLTVCRHDTLLSVTEFPSLGVPSITFRPVTLTFDL